MCGRYVCSADREEIVREFHLSDAPANPEFFRPNYNVAVSQQVLVIKQDEDERIPAKMEWSLLPYWSKERKLKYPTFNARGETIAEKSSFKKPFERSRCLIVNNGFYEWNKSEDNQPYFIYLKEKPVAAFAGLWDRWKDRESGEVVESCTIITTEPNELTAPIHDRMPVFLHPQDYDEWLDPENYDMRSLQRLIRPYEADLMDCYRVKRDVGSVKNNRPDLVEPLA